MYFPCVEQCPRQDFQSRKSLSSHQYRCKYFRDYDASLSGPIDTPSSPSPEVSSGSGLEPASKRQRIAGPASVIDEYQAGLGTPSRPLTRSQAKKLLTGFRLGHDVLPEAAPPLEPPPNTASASQPKARRATPFHTIPDTFGRYRVYPSRPLTIPDSEAPPAPILPGSDDSSPADSRSVNEIIYPCPNISTFYVQRHHWLRGGNKSLDDRDRLCDEVFLQPDFNPGDLAGVNLRALDSKLAASANTWDTTCPPAEGWRHVPIQIQVPPLRQTKLDLSKGLLSPKHYLRIPGLRSRKLTEGELNHRKIKAQYARTNKKDAEDQMTRLSDIAEVLENMDKELQQREQLSCPPEPADYEATQSLLNGSGYFIGLSERSEDMIPSIAQWVDRQREDDAMKISLFIPQLKQHILARILGGRNHPDFNNNTLAQLQFHRGRMYRHKTLCINYTSYDVLRQQDVINPSTPQCFVALPAAHDPLELKNHPFIYAKVIGVYHANYVFRNLVPRRIDFVHVRWLYYDYDCPGGWDLCRLDRVSYDICRTEQDILDSFDFIDPNDIIRATHLIPDFHSGIANNLLNNSPGHSIAHDNEEYGDWKNYYVNRFVDRDMMMRYVGGGIGHFKQDVNAPMVTPEDCAMGHNDEGHPEDDAESDKEDEENGVARGVQADDGLDELSEEEEGSESAAQDEDEDDL